MRNHVRTSLRAAVLACPARTVSSWHVRSDDCELSGCTDDVRRDATRRRVAIRARSQGRWLVKPVGAVASVPATEAWARVQRGEARLLDLRTALERSRFGWPPGAPRVSLARHVASPGGPNTIYLCQHANRSKLTGRRGASEVEGGWPAWEAAGLPVERGEPESSVP